MIHSFTRSIQLAPAFPRALQKDVQRSQFSKDLVSSLILLSPVYNPKVSSSTHNRFVRRSVVLVSLYVCGWVVPVLLWWAYLADWRGCWFNEDPTLIIGIIYQG